MAKTANREKAKSAGMSAVARAYEDPVEFNDRLGELVAVVQGMEAKLDQIHAQISGQLKPFYSVEETASMAAVLASADRARQFARRIRRWIPGTPVITARRPLTRMSRLIVSTFYGLAHTEVEKLDLVLLPRATDAIHQRGLFALQHARRARMYGLLESGSTVAPRDCDWLVALFGPAELQIPRHGHQAIPMDVIWTPVKAAALPLDISPSELRRKGIEKHPIRNRRIGRLATAIAANRRSLLEQDYPSVAQVLNGRSNPYRLAVLVASVDHALTLASRLKGYPIRTGPEVILHGLSPEKRHLLETRRFEGPVDPPYIATTAAATEIDLTAIDLLLWAGGGPFPPPLPPEWLICCAEEEHRILVVDLDDRHHPQLRRFSRRRRRT